MLADERFGHGQDGNGNMRKRVFIAFAILFSLAIQANAGQYEYVTTIAENIQSSPGTMQQTVTPLSDDDLQRLEAQRQIVKRYLSGASLEKFEKPAGKLGTLRALLEASVFSADQTYELQCMGIVLGDVFVQEMGFHWIMVEDEFGRDPAIRFEDTSIILFPLTMISKRVESGESVDVFELFNGVADLAQQKIDAEMNAR